MDPGVSDRLDGVFPNKVYATLEIRACRRNYQCTLQGRLILSIVVSTVTGHFMLKPDPTTTNYILYLLAPSFGSSRGCRGRELGGMFINVYNLLLYNVAATSASLLPLLLMLVVSSPMLQDIVGRC